MDYEKEALSYHEANPKGKIAVNYTKPLDSQEDLSKAYSPGVAGPCREIHANRDASFSYTTRGNLVGVITNGSAVLGLGNIGPYAAKPVMEGKAMLFKKFADIDVFDIEIDSSDPDDFINKVKGLEPTFGGINLEDIKAPECFYIEEKLKNEMSIPVFHDDQHGTAIIAAAAFLNACELTNRPIESVKVVFSGAGAAAISCAALFKTLGVKPEHLLMCDSKGVINKKRSGLNKYKERFAVDTDCETLADAMKACDAFVGVSQGNIITESMLLSMNENPIIFALANPDPEVDPKLARKVRPDVIIGTGRSDFPNQVNNVLGFPYIFRGALDVRATAINEDMKLAAVHAIAALAKEDVPEEVMSVYNSSQHYTFGKDYLIPKPVDQRVLLKVAPAVAEAAIKTGVARVNIDIEQYKEQIERMLGPTRRIIRRLRKDISQTQTSSKPRVVMTSGDNAKVLQAAKQVQDGGEVAITLLGKEPKIMLAAEKLGIKDINGIDIIDPTQSDLCDSYAQTLYELRKRKGISHTLAQQIVRHEDYFAAIMLHRGEVDGMITGVTSAYRDAVRPILEIIKPRAHNILAGIYMIAKEQRKIFCADCTINIDPTANELAEIAITSAETAAQFTHEPIRVAMLSFTSFGAGKHPNAKKVSDAVKIIKAKKPDLEVDGEMQADVALNQKLRDKEFPFCELKGNANVLIFPDVTSANIAYKLMTSMGEMTPTGPILVGLQKPAHVLQRSASVQEIVGMTYISAHQALQKSQS